MSNKLIGTSPNQVPSNADLGTLAYQDAKHVSIDESLQISSTVENHIEFKSALSTSKIYRIYNAVGWNPDALLIYNHTDDATVLTIEPGKLGINRGADSLTQTLEVNGTAWVSGGLSVGTTSSPTSKLTIDSGISSSSTTVLDIHQSTNGVDKQVAGIGVLIDNGGESTNAGGMFFQTASGGSLVERLRLTSSGSLELGYGGAPRQQADGQALSIITPANGGGQGIAIKRLDTNSDQNLGEISWSNNTQDGQANVRVKTEGAVNTTDMIFEVNNAGTLVESMVIKGGSGGNVRIGQNTVNWPGNGNSTTGVTIGTEGRVSASYNGDHVWNRNSDGILMSWRRSGAEHGSVSISNSSGTTYNTSSDIRLKTDINPIKDSVEKVKAMNPVIHKWKNNINANAVHGFIAQEMQEVVPEAVTGDPNSEEMMQMDYGRITPVIVAALQNALNEIDELKARIIELESK